MNRYKQREDSSPLPGAAYIRFSSEMQSGSFSLDAQLRQIKEQAERDGIEIVKVFADPAQSAYRKKYRPGINAMREAARRGEFKVLYVHKVGSHWQKVNALKEKLELLNRIPEAAIDRAARNLLNLHDSWEWATREERKMLVRTMMQEAGCDVGTKRIVWVKVNPDYEILFRLTNGLQPDAGRRYWIQEHGAEVDIGDIGEELVQMETEVKIAFPVSHNTLTRAEEYI